MEGLVQELIKTLAPIIVTVIGALIAWGLAELKRFIKTKTNNEMALHALESVKHVTKTVVNDVGATFQTAAADGSISPEEGAQMKALAIQKIKELIPKEVESNSKMIVADLNKYIESRIEREIEKKKNE